MAPMVSGSARESLSGLAHNPSGGVCCRDERKQDCEEAVLSPCLLFKSGPVAKWRVLPPRDQAMGGIGVDKSRIGAWARTASTISAVEPTATQSTIMMRQRPYQRPRPYQPPPPSNTTRRTIMRSVVTSICGSHGGAFDALQLRPTATMACSFHPSGDAHPCKAYAPLGVLIHIERTSSHRANVSVPLHVTRKSDTRSAAGEVPGARRQRRVPANLERFPVHLQVLTELGLQLVKIAHNGK
jgi:hypothetical protein